MFGRDNGRLEIAGIPSSQILDGLDDSFSYESVITKETYLYVSPLQVGHDAAVKPQFTRLSAAAAAASTDVVIEPVQSGDQTVLAIKKLKPGQKIFARKLPGYPQVLDVTLFTPNINKVAGMEETGLGVQAGEHGYIDCKFAQKDSAAGELFEPFPDGDCLFPNPDLMKDIAQYRLGDCFLLAPIQAIMTLPTGSDLIRGMMRKDGNRPIIPPK